MDGKVTTGLKGPVGAPLGVRDKQAVREHKEAKNGSKWIVADICSVSQSKNLSSQTPENPEKNELRTPHPIYG